MKQHQQFLNRLLYHLIIFVNQHLFWRSFAYSGWNILKSVDIKQEVESMIKKDKKFIKNKLVLVRYCYKHNYPLDILNGIQTSLFLRKAVRS